MAGTVDLTERATLQEARKRVAEIAQAVAVVAVGLQQFQQGIDGLLALLDQACDEPPN